MKRDTEKKYRIVKVTFGDKSERFILEKKNWFGKWSNCMFECPDWDWEGDFRFPKTFQTLEEAEKAYYCQFVSPIAEVVKELP